MLTVLLATRNRARVLREVLKAYCELHQPECGWKLVVIDNGSTDETPLVIDSFATRLPLQSLQEPRLGKNFALNAGLELAEGDLTVFTDDDAFPHAEWLVQLRKAADAQPAYSIFGGAILPRWEVPPPPWIQWIDPGPVFTFTDPSLKEGLTPPFLIYGPNMAIRHNALQSGTRLDPSIGPQGRNYAMGSEMEFNLRLTSEGHKAWHVPGAVVEHFVRAEQLNKAWVLQRAIRFGRGSYRLLLAGHSLSVFPYRLSGNPKLWMGIPQYLFRKFFREGLVMIASLVSFRQDALFRSRWQFNFLRGQAIEARILARKPA